MPTNLFVVNQPERWPFKIPGAEVVAARQYLTDSKYASMRNCRVFNVCRSYRYQSLGYYVSLLAEARGHKPLPRISTIQDLKSQSLIKVVSEDLEELIKKSLAHLQSEAFVLSIYFSRNLAKHYDRLSRELFNLFPAPLLRAEFKKGANGWVLTNINAISNQDVPDNHRESIAELATTYFSRNSRHPRRKSPPRFSMAILVDKDDPTPPSDSKAIDRFVRAAEAVDISVDIVGKDDYGSLSEYDALFIRSTTAVNNHTYRWARRAEAEGMVVIDDPESIVKCTNKVFLAELLNRHDVATPRTEILHRDNVVQVMKSLGLPMVLKQPDSAFSLGVVKVKTEDEYRKTVDDLLDKSDLLVAQEFAPTDFDWRIGIIDQRPLYACKYKMARGHWQIYNNEKKGNTGHMGGWETMPVEIVPKKVVKAALKAANLIGNGLYGVDLKQIGKEAVVIEVNDNPSLESDVEDQMIRGYLYERIMEVFLKRMEAIREPRNSD